MQWNRVIDCSGNAFGLERRSKRITAAARDPDRVLRPHRGVAGRNTWHANDVAKTLTVTFGNAVAGIDLVGEDFQFFNKDRRLDRIESRGETDADIVIFVASLPVYAQAPQGIGKAIVVGRHGAAIAVASERLGRE